MGEADLYRDRLALALEAAGLDLWENNLLTGEVTRKASQTFLSLGYTLEETAAYMEQAFELVHPDDVDVVKASVNAHLSGRTPQYRCEFRLKAKDGRWVWFANYGKVMDAHADTPGQRFIGVTFNIDDRKRREQEMEDINRQLAEGSLDDLAIRTRYLDYKYGDGVGDDGGVALPAPALDAPRSQSTGLEQPSLAETK